MSVNKTHDELRMAMGEAKAVFDGSFAVHGKTVKGTMSMGDTYALDFTDGTSLWMTIRHHGPQDGGLTTIEATLKQAPL